MLCAPLRRADYKPWALRWEVTQHDTDSGKLYILPGTDKAGRPVILMRPRLESVVDNDARMRFLVYTLERAAQLGDSSRAIYFWRGGIPENEMRWACMPSATLLSNHK